MSTSGHLAQCGFTPILKSTKKLGTKSHIPPSPRRYQSWLITRNTQSWILQPRHQTVPNNFVQNMYKIPRFLTVLLPNTYWNPKSYYCCLPDAKLLDIPFWALSQFSKHLASIKDSYYSLASPGEVSNLCAWETPQLLPYMTLCAN